MSKQHGCHACHSCQSHLAVRVLILVLVGAMGCSELIPDESSTVTQLPGDAGLGQVGLELNQALLHHLNLQG